ncbi:uncharacterized protein SPSK_02710 [Sporothrix schenckii 1099-18]|uniref:Uncharacterized protein n=1 Tax=Sporothrix schenckii 1099-18 TaxID=1397361 RepID=A0A0F2MBS7_SPOSC|nr:uncharacterized protein SPSK_02710 [Sporothrix schenckii 1099-18]KJR86519.1 hypothetical protein SPSK_02710 [Sporothrix schenckii 1099-18]
MPSVATSGPKAHPNAHLAGLPASLTPPPPVKATNTIWQPSELVPGSYRATGGDRKHRMSSALAFNLNHAIDLLKRSNCGIRDVIRQHESAWVALRLLYNHVVILQTLLERLRDMLENVAHVESVARDVNIYQPHLGDNDNTPKDMPKDRSRGKTEGKTEEKTKGAEAGKQKTTKHAASFSFTVNRNPARTHKSPLAWSRRVLPRVEDMMPELRNYLVTIEEACVWTVRRQSSRFLPDPDAVPLRWNDNYIFATVHKLCSFEQNIEVHMTTCK